MAAEDEASFIAALREAYLKQGRKFGAEEEAHAATAARRGRDFVGSLRKHFYVSCWHMSHAESLAMWKVYTSMRDSICIRSTYQELWRCLPAKNCFMGRVRYRDYDLDSFEFGNVFNLLMHKRSSFAYEQGPRGRALEGRTPSRGPEPI
jgi:hypothetical protein